MKDKATNEVSEDTLEYIKTSLRIDHTAFDNTIKILVKASESAMRNAGVSQEQIDSNSDYVKLGHFHFVQPNFKDGKQSGASDYQLSDMYNYIIDQLRFSSYE